MQRAWTLIPILAFLMMLSAPANAQDEKEEVATDEWKLKGHIGLNLAQSTFSENWAGGEKSNVTWIANGGFSARRLMRGFIDWNTDLNLAFGQQSRREDNDSGGTSWTRPEKTTDVILMESTALFNTHQFVEPYVSLRFDSFFVDDTSPQGKILYNPLKFTETAGIARVMDKTEVREWIIRAGFGFRQTWGHSYTSLDSDDKEGFSTYDGGFELQTSAEYPLWDEDIIYKGKLLFFWPIYYSQKEQLRDFDERFADSLGRERVSDFWKAPDMNWQNNITAQLNSVISVNFYLQLVYDKFDQSTNVDLDLDDDVLLSEVDGGIRKKGQFQQVLAVGLTYNFF